MQNEILVLVVRSPLFFTPYTSKSKERVAVSVSTAWWEGILALGEGKTGQGKNGRSGGGGDQTWEGERMAAGAVAESYPPCPEPWILT